VDAHTASSAEVLAAALRAHGRAEVHGGPTWGKRHAEWLQGVPGQAHRRVACPLLAAP
jgi:C-terminal processing protease CtpA/Prc